MSRYSSLYEQVGRNSVAEGKQILQAIVLRPFVLYQRSLKEGIIGPCQTFFALCTHFMFRLALRPALREISVIIWD